MAELLERIKEIFTSKAALITVSVVAGLALIGGITTAVILDKRSQDPIKPEPEEPAEQISEPEPEPEQEPEPVTADSLLRDLTGRMEEANFVAGETEFVILPVVSEDEAGPDAEEPATEEPMVEETAAIEEEPPVPDNSICYAFEADRKSGTLHTAGTVTKDGAGTGTESYVITKDGTIRVLSSRGGVWSSQEDEEIGPAIRGIDDIAGLLRLSGCTLEQTTTEEGEERYVLKTRLNAGKTAVFLLAAGVGEEFSQDTLDAFTGADAELILKTDGLPEKMTVTAPATTEQEGFKWSMLFTGIDDGRSVTVPLEEIEQVIQTQEEQKQEQKNNSSDDKEDTDSTDTLDAGYHTNVWVDVDLTNQKITLYADGKAVMSSSCVTGSITRGYATPTGTYRVSYKTTNAYLLNNAYVNYWMPFNGGIGFHDASWRYGNFSADQAWSNGSHGCVNLPYSAAQTLYSYLHAGDVVVVHGWPQNPASSHIHTAGDWETVKEATCKEEGKRVRKCTGCGEVVESGVIAKTDHTEGEWVVTKEATEDETGVKELHCSVCDAVLKTEKIPKTAHVHTANGKWEITKNPTCTQEGQRIQRCVKDNTVVLTETIPASGHQWKTTAENPASCTQNGTRTKICTVCGAEETETIPASGHQWSVTEDPATCTQDGIRTKTCTVCGAQETETLPTLGHNWGETDAEGWRHCSRCGESDYVGAPGTGDSDGE